MVVAPAGATTIAAINDYPYDRAGSSLPTTVRSCSSICAK